MQQPGVVRDRDVGRRKRQDRAAQVGAGEIARERAGIRDDLRASGFSPGPPRTQTAMPCAVSAPRDAPRRRCAGQRFDGPTAPGASATAGAAR